MGAQLHRIARAPAWLTLPAAGLLLAACAWPVQTLLAATGQDPSFEVALGMASHSGISFGDDLIYTYGPLGYLKNAVYSHATETRLAVLYTLALWTATGAAVFWAVRRHVRFGLLALPLAVVVMGFLPRDAAPALAFIAAVAVAERRAAGAAMAPAAAAFGAWTGLELLVKLNSGIVVGLLGAVALLAGGPARLRTLAWFAGSAAGVAIALWLAAGESLGALDDYAINSLAVVSGYSETMAADGEPGVWQKWAAVLVCGVGLYAALRASELAPGRLRLALVGLWAVFAFTTFKQGFVRYDFAHGYQFFALTLVGLLAFVWPRPEREAFVLAVLLVAMAFFGSSGSDPSQLFKPVAGAKRFAGQLRDISGGERLGSKILASRAELSQRYALSPEVFAAIGERSVHTDPETNVVWSNGFRWQPLPVFQSFSAYTERLDRIQAEAIAGPDAPERLLRSPTGVFDNRVPAFDPPASVRSMLCHYVPKLTTPNWQVLERVADRCGPERPMGERRARWGEVVGVPAPPSPRSMVVVRVEGVQIGGLEKLRSALYRGRRRFVTVNGGERRLVPGTAGDGLTLSVPGDSDYGEAFAIGPAARTIAFRREGSEGGGSLTLRFSSVDIAPSPRPPTPAG